jgi:outer membrane protein
MVVLRVGSLILFAFMTLSGSNAWAQAAAPQRFAFVDVERAIALSEEGKVRLGELQEWARPRQEELARLASEISNLQNEIASRQGAATQEALADMNRRLVSRQREFEDRQRIARRELEDRQSRLLRELGEKLQQVINVHSEQQRYTAVFIFRPDELAFLSPDADITERIIQLYNERFPYRR